MLYKDVLGFAVHVTEDRLIVWAPNYGSVYCPSTNCEPAKRMGLRLTELFAPTDWLTLDLGKNANRTNPELLALSFREAKLDSTPFKVEYNLK